MNRRTFLASLSAACAAIATPFTYAATAIKRSVSKKPTIRTIVVPKIEYPGRVILPIVIDKATGVSSIWYRQNVIFKSEFKPSIMLRIVQLSDGFGEILSDGRWLAPETWKFDQDLKDDVPTSNTAIAEILCNVSQETPVVRIETDPTQYDPTKLPIDLSGKKLTMEEYAERIHQEGVEFDEMEPLPDIITAERMIEIDDMDHDEFKKWRASLYKNGKESRLGSNFRAENQGGFLDPVTVNKNTRKPFTVDRTIMTSDDS